MRRNNRLLWSIAAVLWLSTAVVFSQNKNFKVTEAQLIGDNLIRMKCTGLNKDYAKIKLSVTQGIRIVKTTRKGPFLELATSGKYQEGVDYQIHYHAGGNRGEIALNTEYLVDKRFNEMYTEKELGYSYKNGISTFRLFVPRGVKVNLILFEQYNDEAGKVIPMKNDGNQVFEYSEKGALWGKYYGYQIVERSYTPKKLSPDIPLDTIFADPYSKALASDNVFPSKSRTLIYDTSKFQWGNTDYTKMDIESAVILEAHVKDLTAHPSAKSGNPGTFSGLLNAEVGGLAYIQKLGVNAVEFLPIQNFSELEAPPFGETSHGVKNTWNAYTRNYWGYMTNNFFTPETFYGTDGNTDPTKWNGTDARVVDEFKTVVKEMHKRGISVILDVVYNHVSQNDVNALKLIDYDFYFKKKEKTGCGNEVETRRKMVRRLVLDSVKYWMTDYKIDGFRFDLATSHDRETIQAIYDEARKINPKVMLIAEPWGGEGATNKADFKAIGWSYWNDDIRGIIRGTNNRPNKPGVSFMLGSADVADKLIPFWKGTATAKAGQTVSYIESHDDATLGDMIRILSGTYNIRKADGSFNRIKDIPAYLKLSPKLLAASKVGATALFLCQGPIMIHLGQEWARGKIVPDLSKQGIPEVANKGEPGVGSDNVIFLTPTPNSYFADNDTNYINYDYIRLNQPLFDYYQGLIALRKAQPLLGQAKPEQIQILESQNKKSLGVVIAKKIIGLVNADPDQTVTYTIPEGKYDVVADKEKAGITPLREIQGGSITVEKSSSLILIKK